MGWYCQNTLLLLYGLRTVGSENWSFLMVDSTWNIGHLLACSRPSRQNVNTLSKWNAMSSLDQYFWNNRCLKYFDIAAQGGTTIITENLKLSTIYAGWISHLLTSARFVERKKYQLKWYVDLSLHFRKRHTINSAY